MKSIKLYTVCIQIVHIFTNLSNTAFLDTNLCTECDSTLSLKQFLNKSDLESSQEPDCLPVLSSFTTLPVASVPL